MIQLKIKSLEMAEGSPLVRVTLQDVESENELRIYIGWPEAIAIQTHIEEQIEKPSRPFTHDLMANILSILKTKVIQLLISDMREDTYIAILTLSAEGKIHEVDCRPSDGLALAVRCAAPIYIHEELMERIKLLEQERDIQPPHPGAMVVERDDTTIH